MSDDRFHPLKPLEVHGDPGPVRRLILRCRLGHGMGYPVTNLRFRLAIRICDVLAYEGDVTRWTPVAQPSLVGEGGVDVEIYVPLHRGVLAAIEHRRAGGSAHIRLQGDVTYGIAHRIPNQGHWTVGETRSKDIRQDGAKEWQQDVPQSDWIRVLKELGWQHIELMELPMELEGDREALRHLEAAKVRLASGDWPGVLARCYNAIEAVAPQGKEAAGRRAPHLSGAARDALDQMLFKAKAFCHDGRHHDAGPDNVGPDEARMILLMAAGLVQYFSGSPGALAADEHAQAAMG